MITEKSCGAIVYTCEIRRSKKRGDKDYCNKQREIWINIWVMPSIWYQLQWIYQISHKEQKYFRIGAFRAFYWKSCFLYEGRNLCHFCEQKRRRLLPSMSLKNFILLVFLIWLLTFIWYVNQEFYITFQLAFIGNRVYNIF